MKSRLSFILIFCLISLLSFAQSGLSVYTGLSFAVNQDAQVTPSGSLHSGYHIGADARIFSESSMFFQIGAQYHKIGVLASESLTVAPKDGMSIIKGKAGLGFYLFSTKVLRLRLKTQGVIDYVFDYDRSLIIDNPPYDRLNEAHLGAMAGVGIDFLFLTFDLDYEYGLINAYFDRPDTKFNYLTLSVGVFF